MKAEFIIAVRGENGALLRCTVMAAQKQAPVHVVFDGDETPMIDGLPADTSQPWKDPRGCAQARHYGIMDSDADVVILCDGHMSFPDALVATVMKHLTKHKKDLLCCQTRGADKGLQFCDERVYTGAFLSYKQTCREDCLTDYHGIKGHWNPEHTPPGPVGCVMGACYAFRRDWYEAIGKPLAILDEWGGDEEVLSLGTLFMGGRVICLPLVCGHVFKSPRTNRTDAPENNERRISNRFAILRALPIPEPERVRLEDHMMQKKRDYPSIIRRITTEREKDIVALHALWATGKRDWAALKAGGMVRCLTETEHHDAMGFRPAPVAANPQAQPPTPRFIVPTYREPDRPVPPPPHDVCERCDAVGQWDKAPGYTGMKTCRRCGHKQNKKPWEPSDDRRTVQMGDNFWRKQAAT
jgi:hypothetical protein